MCVALPGKVIELQDKTAVVDFNGNQVTARMGLVDIKVGDFVLVHAGCILQKVSQKDANSLNELMEQIGGFS
ncbi:MAG: HypC/HybG/HupF family hydrogenase formation chaperone [Lachnospiraceae bacterium]|nr:HypC/HybG/HupF family hydrogenase formation chaperone [Lachnospiraceae bacterium]